jgi:hypothetical protein
MPPWGPALRPAAVAVAFAGLATPSPGHPVTPALSTLLRVLSDRDLYATFFVEPEIAAAEPFALEMIGLSANEIGLLAATGADVAAGLATLREAGAQPAGALLGSGAAAGEAGAGEPDAAAARTTGAGEPGADTAPGDEPGAAALAPETAAALRAAGADYLALPGATPAGPPQRAADGLARIAVARDDAADPTAFHRAFQAAVGATLSQRGLLTVALPAHRFERRDALDVLVESLDLVAGLRRAERLWTPTLAELAAAAPGAG